jgi:hypothetical protein
MSQRESRPGNTEAAPHDLADHHNRNGKGPTSAVKTAKQVSMQVGRRLDWKNDVLPVAKGIVESYDTGVTLRQLFYRLVSLKDGERGRIPNTHSMYTALAYNTAQARYAGQFPDLVDQRRSITQAEGWSSPKSAITELRDCYKRDHTEGQPYQIWLGSEKEGLVNQLWNWFGGDMGLPIIALIGQCSVPYRDKILRQVGADSRPAILLYAGDHDPTGWSILQNFVDRTDCWVNDDLPDWDSSEMPMSLGRKKGHARKWSEIPNFDRYRKFRVALTPEQCDEYDLARNTAKAQDPSMNTFLANFEHTLTDDEVDDGLGVQVEVDALEPTDLRDLFTDAIDQYWDTDAYDAVLADEEADREELDVIVSQLAWRRRR